MVETEKNGGQEQDFNSTNFEASEKIEREIEKVDKIYQEMDNNFRIGVREGLQVALHILKEGVSK